MGARSLFHCFITVLLVSVFFLVVLNILLDLKFSRRRRYTDELQVNSELSKKEGVIEQDSRNDVVPAQSILENTNAFESDTFEKRHIQGLVSDHNKHVKATRRPKRLKKLSTSAKPVEVTKIEAKEVIENSALINNQNSYNHNAGFSISELMEGIPQDDMRILDHIRSHHLFAPSPLPYNLSEPNVDPGAYIGQYKVAQRILGNKREGIFVEAGAHNGEYISNTLTLEREFEWTGLLIEPSPEVFSELVSKRRKAWLSNTCLSPSPLPANMELLHRINYTIANKLGTRDEIRNYEEYWEVNGKVPCFPVFSILSALGIRTVDYFSLDVEGVELKVLKTIPFDKVFIKVFSVEIELIPEGKDELRLFMESKGYVFVQEVYHDYIFAHGSLPNSRPVQMY